MLWQDIALTPLSLFFISLLVGISIDDSVYIVSQREYSNEALHLFPIFVTTVVIAIGFISLGFSEFGWIRPFAWVFLLGLMCAYLLDVFFLPLLYEPRSNLNEHV
jgi:predicted RND superfamily exporter protein